SVFELFVPLSVGDTLVIVEDALELVHLEGREQLTIMSMVPSAMAELLRLGAIPQSVEVLNLGGEPLKKSLADQLYEAGIRQVYDLYGPSEDTTYSTVALREWGGVETI